MRGKIIIVSAPSGCGKGTIIKRLMTEHPELRLTFSVSATSRQPRDGETDGVHYHFMTPDEFRRHIECGDFIEYVEVYKDTYYGTLRSEVDHRLEQGDNVVLDIDVEGGCRVKQLYGDRALAFFLLPPSVDVLRQRLIGRGTETMDKIEKRLARSEYELSFAPRYDVTVMNDDLDRAVAESCAVIRDFLAPEN